MASGEDGRAARARLGAVGRRLRRRVGAPAPAAAPAPPPPPAPAAPDWTGTSPGAIAARVEDIAVAIGRIELRQEQLAQAVRHAAEQEALFRRLLGQLRREPAYAAAFDEPDPLVSVCIPTYDSVATLVERAVPSALAQDHPRIEVVVVGDAAAPGTGEALRALGDPRVRYEDLPLRGPYPDDARARWLVAGTGPLNRAMELAEGRWIAVLNDDDAFRPDHVSRLLAFARADRLEVAYGRIEQHRPDGTSEPLGGFPPADHRFGWQMALQHAAMTLFDYELAAHLFDVPGDWHRARRMLRAGVRFGHLEHTVADYWPSTLWRARGD
jgi:hypothetical protein